VLHSDGVTWNRVDLGTPQDLNGVSGSGPSDVWVVGRAYVAHFDGTTWTTIATSTSWSDVASDGPGTAWLAGDGGAAGHITGGRLSVRRNPEVEDRLLGVWASGPDNAWFVGPRGLLLHYDGITRDLQRVPSGTFQTLTSVWGSGPDDLWAVGDAIVHYDGTRWSPFRADRAGLTAVGGSGAGDVWALGADGAVLRLRHPLPHLLGGACPAPRPLTCGSIVTGTTDGARADVARHACATRDTRGPEVYYRLESALTGQVIVELRGGTDFGQDLDLIAIGADGANRCAPSQCLGASQNDGWNPEKLVLQTFAGQTVYLAIDSREAGAPYALQVLCLKP
jgi:hypothetical protein